ncbi:MAG: cardiolipin synthase ClsB [Burkholderiaceae bacterium]|nr:cardiolipin synthase ClsB [Burkholderiaceae bacterium]
MKQLRFLPSNEVRLLHNGAEFFPSLIDAIDQAAVEIFLEYYIYADDDVSADVSDALVRAAARGVRVHVISDWLGTGRLHTALLKQKLAGTGVLHRTFNPWFRRGIARTHRKLCAVDRKVGFVGGINIVDDMFSDDGVYLALAEPRWDFAVRIEGPLAAAIHKEIEAQWLRMGSLKIKERIGLYRELRSGPPLVQAGMGEVSAALVVRDNLRNRRTIQRAYLQALGHARRKVVFANPYFAPGRKLRRALEAAAARGVDVTVLLGVGQFLLQDAVAHSFYPKLLRAGVKIVEYRKTQLHAKVAVVDEDWTTVGSSNYDGLSLFINQEANVVIRDAKFAVALRAQIEKGIADGVAVHLADYANIRWYKRFWYGVAFMLYETIIRVATWSKYT